jgi:hypothetical protein
MHQHPSSLQKVGSIAWEKGGHVHCSFLILHGQGKIYICIFFVGSVVFIISSIPFNSVVFYRASHLPLELRAGFKKLPINPNSNILNLHWFATGWIPILLIKRRYLLTTMLMEHLEELFRHHAKCSKQQMSLLHSLFSSFLWIVSSIISGQWRSLGLLQAGVHSSNYLEITAKLRADFSKNLAACMAFKNKWFLSSWSLHLSSARYISFQSTK